MWDILWSVMASIPVLRRTQKICGGVRTPFFIDIVSASMAGGIVLGSGRHLRCHKRCQCRCKKPSKGWMPTSRI
eukprot:symbB.v1.2.020729.t1/scaffold1754.1/size102984/4